MTAILYSIKKRCKGTKIRTHVCVKIRQKRGIALLGDKFIENNISAQQKFKRKIHKNKLDISTFVNFLRDFLAYLTLFLYLCTRNSSEKVRKKHETRVEKVRISNNGLWHV